jgi:hypothetical protein
MREQYGASTLTLTSNYQNRKCEIPFIYECNLCTLGADLSPHLWLTRPTRFDLLLQGSIKELGRNFRSSGCNNLIPPLGPSHRHNRRSPEPEDFLRKEREH